MHTFHILFKKFCKFPYFISMLIYEFKTLCYLLGEWTMVKSYKVKFSNFWHNFHSAMPNVSGKVYALMQESHWGMHWKTSIILHGQLQTPWEPKVSTARTSRGEPVPISRRNLHKCTEEQARWNLLSPTLRSEQSHPKSRAFSQYRASTHEIPNMDPALQCILIFTIKCIVILSHCKILFSP